MATLLDIPYPNAQRVELGHYTIPQWDVCDDLHIACQNLGSAWSNTFIAANMAEHDRIVGRLDFDCDIADCYSML